MKILWRGIFMLISLVLMSAVHADTFQDNFGSISYSNQNGTVNWSGDWIESGDNNSPFGGSIYIAGGSLVLNGAGSSPSVERQADLSAYTSAILSFDYSETGFWEGNDDIYVDVSSNGGVTWTRIHTFTNDQGAIPQTYSVDISSYISSNFRLRFVEGADSFFEVFYIDNVVIDATGAATSCVTYLDQFSTQAYDRQDGTGLWSANWNEVGDDGSAASGSMLVSGGELALVGNGSGLPYIERELDLSGYTSATLSLFYRETGAWEGNDDIYIDISNNGGTSWTRLRTFTNDQGATSQAYSVDISAYMASNTRIRFVENANAFDEIFYFDDVQIEACGGATPLVQYNFDETLWNGTAGEAVDATGNGYDATAVNGAFTDFTTPDPAIAGDPGTCRYGEFDGVNDYVAVPASFPNMTGSFTITAWIYAGDNTGDHRIFADDQSNSSGYALSLGDGTNGALRFFSRSVNPVSVDTPTGTIATNTWYHVAAVHDANAKTRQIYVNGVAQSLNGGGSTSTYTGTWGSDSGPVSIGGETSASAESATGFRFNGMIDEVRVYDAALTQSQIDSIRQETRPCSLVVVDHYAINWSGSALTCEPIAVTITAHNNADSAVVPPAGTTIDLSTSTAQGLWSNPDTGALIDNGNGDASYTFSGNSSVTLNFNHPTAALVNFDINNGSSPNEGVGLEDPDITFVDSGFRIIDGNDNPIAIQTAAKPSPNTNPSQLYLQAVRTDSNSMACVNAFAPGTLADVDWAVECNNPSTCIAGTDMSVAYASSSGIVTAAVPAQDDVATPAYTSLAGMLFGSDSKAAIILTYPEAGQLQVHTRYEVLDGTGAGTGNFISGLSQFAVKPVGFCVEAQAMGAADPACSVAPLDQCTRYVKAEENFDLLIAAKAWESNADTDFCDNVTTQNFASTNLTVVSNLVAPLPGTSGSLSVAAGMTINSGSGGGSVVVSERYSEVGVATFDVEDNNYFGDTITGSSVNVGRFYPDHFALVSGAVVPAHITAADQYTYFGQPFSVSYTLEARSVLGNPTANYIDGFARLDPTSHTWLGDTTAADIEYAAADTVTPQTFNDLVVSSPSAATWSAGQLVVLALPMTISKPSPAIGPVTDVDIGLYVEDSDTVTLVPSVLPSALDLDSAATGTGVDSVKIDDLAGTLFYGRLFFPPVYGPEIFAGQTTPVPFEIQYFDGSIFSVNSIDSDNAPGDSPSQYGAGTPMQDLSAVTSNHTGNINAADVTSADIDFPNTLVSVIGGRGNLITVNRPGAGKDGSVDVTFPVQTWFQYDWNNTGTEVDPTTTITFGRYRGHDRIIYWREVH